MPAERRTGAAHADTDRADTPDRADTRTARASAPEPLPATLPDGSASTEYPDAPRVAIGALVMHGGRLLVVERGKAPAEGIWALPGGSVELGETLAEATEREVFEETSVVVRAGAVVHAFDAVVRDDDGRVRFHYAIIDLACEYRSGEASAGGDARDARFVTREEFATLRSSRATVDLLRRITNFLGDAKSSD